MDSEEGPELKGRHRRGSRRLGIDTKQLYLRAW